MNRLGLQRLARRYSRLWVLIAAAFGSVALAASCSKHEFENSLPSESHGGSSGEGGGDTVEGLRLGLEGRTLPDASFNVSYRVQLEATGAPKDQVAFGVNSEDLPTGLSLKPDGELTGTPLEHGTFEFDVEVTAGEQTADARFRVEVRRKHWLVFSGDADTVGRRMLYSVDTASALLPVTLLSTDVEPGGDVSSYTFSADGSRLAYLADSAGVGKNSLYVVDFSGPQPRDAVRIDDDRPVVAFALRPDGDGIVYSVELATDSWELQYVDLAATQPSSPAAIGPATKAQPTWLTGERILYGLEDGNATRVRESDEFGPVELLHYGVLGGLDRSRERVVFTSATTICAMNGWLYDFKNSGAMTPAPAEEDYRWPTYNRQLTRVAHLYGPSGMFLFDATRTDGEPLGLVSPTSTCDRVFWSPLGDRVLIPSDENRLLLTTISSDSVRTDEVPGIYDSSYRVAYLGNDRFVFATQDRVFESRIEDDEPTDAVPIHEPLAEDGEVLFLSGAPNASWAFYVGAQDQPATPGPYSVDVRQKPVGAPRKLASTDVVVTIVPSQAAFEAPERNPSWSGDSARLAFLGQSGATAPFSTRLFIADMLHETAVAAPVTPGTCYAGSPVTCHRVESFLFQP